jgi:hypothetical protein
MYSRLIALPIFLLLLLQASFAQNISREAPIVAGEYFIGQDPGKGKGTQIPINNPAAKIDVPIPNISLQAGQKFYIRFKNKNGYWTAPRGITYTGTGVQRGVNIQQAEYFIGADPGRGKGKPITLTPNTTVNLNLPALSLLKGQRLSIRVKDAENRWSAPASFVYSGVGNNRNALIANAEYFIGADPGRGKGKPITITSATTVNLNPPALSLSKGQKVFFRIRDTENRWSEPAAIAYAGYGLKRDALIAAAEYFIGADPGRGNGTKISIAQADSAIINLSAVPLSKTQKLHLRVQDVEKRWSDPVTLSYPPRFIRSAEIVVANDPSKVSFGKGFAMTAQDGAFGSAYEVIQGTASWNRIDSIWVRAQSSEYLWSKPVGDNMAIYPVPTLTGINLVNGERLQTLEVVLTGTDFIANATKADFGAGIAVNSGMITSTTNLKANISISANAVTGPRDVSVTNPTPGGGVAKLTGVFMVKNPLPILTSLAPKTGYRRQTLNVGCKGGKFISGASSVIAGASIKVNQVIIHRTDSLTANITIAEKAPLGPQSIMVVNNRPGGGNSTQQFFTIVNQIPTPPRLLAPANKDTIRLVTPPKPIKFVWRKSSDGDAQDTLRYSINIKGLGLDTTVAAIKDTNVTLNIMLRLKAKSTYLWTVRVTDGFLTLTSQETFAFHTPDVVIGINETLLSPIPTEFRLEQNHPNPFNPATKIRYQLPQRAKVNLKIYDLMGHEVAVLVDEEKPPGKFEVVWQPESLGSGVYFYRLQAGDFVQVKKTVLTR